jgi:hypothetical protein
MLVIFVFPNKFIIKIDLIIYLMIILMYYKYYYYFYIFDQSLLNVTSQEVRKINNMERRTYIFIITCPLASNLCAKCMCDQGLKNRSNLSKFGAFGGSQFFKNGHCSYKNQYCSRKNQYYSSKIQRKNKTRPDPISFDPPNF